jgi:fatty acid desaturase
MALNMQLAFQVIYSGATMKTLPASYQRLWRETHGTLPNTFALVYGILGHALGIYMILQPGLLPVIPGILLTGHTLIICAYLVHESAHMTLLKARRHNELVGEVLLWIVGAGYASFQRVRHMHLRHHQDRADVSCFDYQAFLQRQPGIVQKLVVALEWAYIPAIELIMHGQVIIRPFLEEHLKPCRKRVMLMAASRLGFFALMFFISPWAILAYAVAYWLMLQALFLADAFAHTYDAFFVTQSDEPVPSNDRDRDYDIKHTYSNLVSQRWPWLNLLNLNFGYHTAHHEKASVAWHDLPAFHRELYGAGDYEQILPYKYLLKTIHRNRLKRVFVEDYGAVGEGPNRADSFIGAHGVSFLSIV